jgi:uncharacterized membrane protein
MYLVLKLVHVAAAIVFLGNISLGVFWKRLADHTQKAAIMAHTIGGIIRSDRLFTVPAVIVLVAAGVATALVGQIPLLSTGWLLWGIVLISASGAAFGPLARAQKQLYELAQRGLSTDADRAQYRALSQTWDLWGGVALLMPIIALVLMVLKPTLPAFHQ